MDAEYIFKNSYNSKDNSINKGAKDWNRRLSREDTQISSKDRTGRSVPLAFREMQAKASVDKTPLPTHQDGFTGNKGQVSVGTWRHCSPGPSWWECKVEQFFGRESGSSSNGYIRS